jgi:hypothetical protein
VTHGDYAKENDTEGRRLDNASQDGSPQGCRDEEEDGRPSHDRRPQGGRDEEEDDRPSQDGSPQGCRDEEEDDDPPQDDGAEVDGPQDDTP